MKEHNIKEEWPPKDTAILALCILYERKPVITPAHRYPERRIGNYLLYWTIENGSVVWKDPHDYQEYYEVDIQKWWTLDPIA